MERKLNNLIFLISLPILLSSCEGYRSASGVVKDKVTGLPLDSVSCKVTTGTMQIYTDATGVYDVNNNMGSCIGGCKDIAVEFSKRDYKTVVKMQDDANGVIYLEK